MRAKTRCLTAASLSAPDNLPGVEGLEGGMLGVEEVGETEEEPIFRLLCTVSCLESC